MSKRINSAARQGPQTVANDPDVAGVAELVYTGEPINWDYWAGRHNISPDQAARLAYCIDPIRWPDEQHAQGAWSDDLRVKVCALTEWLAERRPSWTLDGLVVALGDSFAPHTMNQATGPMLAAIYVQQSEEKRKAGRYTLEEAAQRLEAEAGERADAMLKKLMAAAKRGDLPVYGPGENARYLYGPGHASHAREDYEEARWNQLNDWLGKEEPYIKYKFPDPSAKSAQVVNKPTSSKPGNDWKEECRKIADELDAQDAKAGAWSSNVDMSGRVAREAIKRCITGPNGQLTAANILREALQGGRWTRKRSKPTE
ncbi:MAG: hypothetical protein FJ209_08275 [Betaproteobacteria bacterium]|nr:hypothetical protein [Betaproteobacteria bacterium]